MTIKYLPFKKKQRGIGLLVLVMVLALTFVTYYFSEISIVGIEADNIQKTRASLKQAKQLLLGYAMTNRYTAGSAGKIGKLPCTDSGVINPVGEQEPQCGNAYANAIGYLPWRTLGSNILKDSSGGCLLYAVSPAYKTNPEAALNPDSYGQFLIVDDTGAGVLQGLVPEDRPVAVILAPGRVLSGQLRNNNFDGLCGADYGNVAAYLDNDGNTNNAAINPGVNNVPENFVQAYSGSEAGPNPLNDSLITITHKEFWEAMDSTITSPTFNGRMENLTEALAQCFAGYGLNNGKHLPMPAVLNLNGGDYRRDSDYDDNNIFTAGFSGRLPYDVSRSNMKLGNGNAPVIFINPYCDALELVSTPGVALDGINFSNTTGNDVGEYFDLWQNWKDHFFYAISNANRPDAAAVAACAGNCIRVNGIEYAGVIFFSGLKLKGAGPWPLAVGQTRYAPPVGGSAADGFDDKDDVVNYLENGNYLLFPDNAGNAAYSKVALPSNDVMYCIKDDMSVVKCL